MDNLDLQLNERNYARIECPKCGGMVRYSMHGQVKVIDYHHDVSKGFLAWCDGSDMVVDDEQP